MEKRHIIVVVIGILIFMISVLSGIFIGINKNNKTSIIDTETEEIITITDEDCL